MPISTQVLPIHTSLPKASQIAFGCMGLGGSWDNSPIDKGLIDHAEEAVLSAVENGINFFDHADIYTMGKAELCFGEVLKRQPQLRSNIYIQSKCGIRFEDETAPGRYDFSAQWLETSVDGILQRLGIEYLDVLALHRPDPLMELDELAAILMSLKAAGKFMHLGVSNMNAHQIQYLQTALDTPLIVNQVELSLARREHFEFGVAPCIDPQIDASFAGTLQHCQVEGIQLQSWGSLAQGLFCGRGDNSDHAAVRETSQLVATLAGEYQVSKEAIVMAWLLRHGANIQTIIGTANPKRIKACAQAAQVELSREHWYQLLVSARGQALP